MRDMTDDDGIHKTRKREKIGFRIEEEARDRNYKRQKFY